MRGKNEGLQPRAFFACATESQPRGNESRSRNSPATACRGPLSEAFFADFETVPLPETATLSRVIFASYIIVSAARRIVGTVFPSSGYVASPKLPDTLSESPAPSRKPADRRSSHIAIVGPLASA